MRIALYARVSTTDQSCEMKLRELHDYVATRGWQVSEEYVDTGWSGAKTRRPALDRLLADARVRRFDVVLVWKLDRWGRSLLDCIHSIQELVSLGVRFLAVTQNFDTDESNPMSRFLLHILAAFGELEREMIRERVRTGLRNARAKGKALGRPKRIFRRDEARRLRAEGMSWRKIAKTLDVPVSTVMAACSSETPHALSNPDALTTNPWARPRASGKHMVSVHLLLGWSGSRQSRGLFINPTDHQSG